MTPYPYVGPKRIAEIALTAPPGTPIRSRADVLAWARASRQEPSDGCVIATYVIDDAGVLLIADRHSEHVACAGGRRVLSAGKIAFRLDADAEVAWLSNQSTGYRPGPESWPAVAAALARAGLEAPEGFTPECVFRVCPGCGCVNIIKGGVYECSVCGSGLLRADKVQR